MTSPTNVRRSGFFNQLFKTKARGSWREGSSRRGRERDEHSVGKDSSNHSGLFDLELSHRSNRSMRGYRPPTYGDGSVSSLPQALVQRVTYLSRPAALFEMDLLQDLQALRDTCATATGSLDIYVLNEELQRMGYACKVVSSESLWEPIDVAAADQKCFKNLRHTYLLCSGKLDGLVHQCIIDPSFREQFEIAHPTPTYLQLLELLPVEFVGSQLRLQTLADILCSEIASAYHQQHLPLPPWRTSAMISRWIGNAPSASLSHNSDNCTSSSNTTKETASEHVTHGSIGGSHTLYTAVDLLTDPVVPAPPLQLEPSELSNKPRRRQRQIELGLAVGQYEPGLYDSSSGVISLASIAEGSPAQGMTSKTNDSAGQQQRMYGTENNVYPSVENAPPRRPNASLLARKLNWLKQRM